MPAKSEQLQIRVSAAQKRRLKQLARTAGLDVSTYVLTRVLPDSAERFQRVVATLRDETDRVYGFAELSDLLVPLGREELENAVERADLTGLSTFSQNYLAATVDYLCAKAGARAPAWTRAVPALAEPWFAVPLRSLRLHLITSSPVAFKRRNLFVDAGPDARV